MIKLGKKILATLILSGLSVMGLWGANLSSKEQKDIEKYLTEYAQRNLAIGTIKIQSSEVDFKRNWLKVYLNENFAYIPYNEENVKDIYTGVSNLLSKENKKYKLSLFAENRLIENYIPYAGKNRFVNKTNKPLISHISRPFSIDNGLENKHIALWQSHGWYFEQKLDRWEWQRARIFQTVEDLYTQSFVLPYLVPMLENAGANVLLPRERDFNKNEVIVDNDSNKGKSQYKESGKWNKGKSKGFAHTKQQYVDWENPFTDGTYRQAETTKNKKKEQFAEWIPEIPESGSYAVYVSYKTLENSTEDALYTVFHKGGSSQFRVNQTMGGGTWIYLGHFSFDKGTSNNAKVTLSNLSYKNGNIVTADAVKIGGGYGNIARIVNAERDVTENRKSSDTSTEKVKTEIPNIDYQYSISTYPRYTEGARYWLQWAGFPDSVYSASKGKNDYTDDYQSRGLWVNYISGGSSVAPQVKGLNIPIDLAFAFHSDAGTTLNDSIIGTLGIYYAPEGETFPNGESKHISHDLTDIIQTQIVNDVRAQFDTKWSRRGKWNKPYSEAKTPNVPTMLLELLSHQNFADMRYGIDPQFRFTVSRAIYKGMLKHIAQQYGYKYVVQPLPVDNMSAEFISDNEVELHWMPVEDNLEPTAKPDKYIVYTRIDDQDFDNGIVVNSPHFKMTIDKDKIYSYKVAAINEGGESFPSEILSVHKASSQKGTILIINGFDRVSAPASLVAGEHAGFNSTLDHGVPDKYDISFIGIQKEFRRSIPWMDDDASGFGDSNSNYETTVIAGNTFDYPALHGKAIAKAGYSFVSCSNEAVMNKVVNLNNYQAVDLILGKQKEVQIGTSPYPAQFKTFPKELQTAISEYCQQGGNIFVSGAYVGTDLWDNKLASKADQEFAQNILKYKWRVGQASVNGKVKSVASPYKAIKGNYEFYNTLNSESYVVESPDAIEPSGNDSFTVFRYSENNLSAGVAHAGNYKTCILGFPFESIKDESERNSLMLDILNFFENNNK